MKTDLYNEYDDKLPSTSIIEEKYNNLIKLSNEKKKFEYELNECNNHRDYTNEINDLEYELKHEYKV